ncbi:unnamed protein product [Didymodactylos carnosus]|uniref:HAD family hydrolase n=1 Tax=Didymodactylos carnosus TaxID=1234261 RepID=A0A8S2FLM3_9BILA|nr:unnamed protein product [Didymodactylos carnosus]CAF4289341.1 unnamed protein product [Didymodactylos carnosus]
MLLKHVSLPYSHYNSTLSKKRELDAVLFDVDGTLIDSVDLHAKAWQDAFRHYDYEVEFKLVREQIGDQLMPLFINENVLKKIGDELQEYRDQLFRENYMSQVKAFPGVRSLFKMIKKRGVKIALASSARENELQIYKRIANIEDLIDGETCSNSKDVKRSKPYPDIFLACLNVLKLSSKDNVIVVGDTQWDAKAAVAAGLKIVGVECGGFSGDLLRQSGCQWVYKDIEQLTRYYDTLCKDVLRYE